jgi:hypothetical protein
MTYRDAIEQYHKIYVRESRNGRIYGKSSEDLLDELSPVIIKLNPKSILDYGCGRSSLINYFWRDGERRLFKYDPAVYDYREKPENTERFDLCLCTDVLEHIPENYLGVILSDLRKFSTWQIITISLIPARRKLPNGENAHCTIRPVEWWKWLLEKSNLRIKKVIKHDSFTYNVLTKKEIV